MYDKILHKWNLHPAKNKWITCYIWPTFEAMESARARRLGISADSDTAAYFLAQEYVLDVERDEIITRKVGEIHLVEENFGVGLIAHEIQHFLSHWQETMGWDVTGNEWEKISNLAGGLHNEFWNEYYKRYDV